MTASTARQSFVLVAAGDCSPPNTEVGVGYDRDANLPTTTFSTVNLLLIKNFLSRRENRAY